MNIMRDDIAVVVGAVVVFVLQVVVAPNITLFAAMPNFLLAYVLLVSILRPRSASPVLPFVLGLLFDLFSGGPLGSMAFLLVSFSFLASRAFAVLDNDTLFMPLIIVVVTALLIEILYGAFMIFVGLDASILAVVVHRALPCALYDSVVALILYPLASRLLVTNRQPRPGMPHLR